MPLDFGKLADKITKRILDNLQDSNQDVQNAGEQVGESFVEGMEQGLEDAASRITASSVKITKAFRDLAKKITNQKDIFNISLGSKDIVIDIDFSDVDINSKDFQKKIDEVFEKFKIDNAIEFDSKTTEKHFKNMIGLHTKYAAKLSKLQEQRPRLTNPDSIKANIQEQLAVIDGLKEVRKILNQTSDMYLDLPSVHFGDVKELRTSISLIEQLEKGEEKVVKQRSSSVEKIKKENKELKERNKILEEKVGPVEGEQTPPAKKPRAKKPKAEPAVNLSSELEEQNRKLEERNGLIEKYIEAQKKRYAIEAKYGSRFNEDATLEDYNEWAAAMDVGREISMRTDADVIMKGVGERLGEEMKTFVLQYENFKSEFGDGSKWFGRFNDFLEQIRRGAITASEAVAKLREETSQRLAEEAFQAQMEEAVAAEVEAELKAEQMELDLAKEELNVEKEITKEKEKQYGYHAGKFRDDGKRAESLWQSTPGRSTGFYGTGTYLTDSAHLNEITTGQYGRRPLNVIDPDMYNLFDATNDKTAGQLHEFLKHITNKAFGGKGENIKSLYAEFKKIFPKEQVITYEDFKSFVGDLQIYVKDNFDNYSKSSLMDSVSTKFMKNFGYEGVDTRGTKYADTTYGTVIYDLKEESVILKEITDEMQKQEIIVGNIASVIEKQARVHEQTKANQSTNQQAKETKNVVKLVDNYGESLDEVNNKLMEGTKLLDEQGRVIRLFHQSNEIFDKFDPSKSGGSQGVGTLGKGNYLHFGNGGKFDDPKYGRYQTQWYANINKVFDAENDELSPEQINGVLDKFLPGLSEGDKKNYINKFGKKYTVQAIKYVAQKANAEVLDVWKYLGYDAVRRGDEINIFDSSKIFRANDNVLDMAQSNKNKFARTINGKSGKFRAKKPAPATHETDSGQMSVLPAVEKEVDVKNKLSDANERVARSQKKINEASKGVQMTIDDIIPSNVEAEASQWMDLTSDDELVSGNKEAEVLDKVGTAAENAAKSKKKFAGANKEVKDSADASEEALEGEKKALDKVGESSKKVGQAVAEDFNSVTSDTKFSTRDYKKFYDEMEAFAEQRKAENGYDLSRVSVNTDAHGNPLGAIISYYKKATKETITETFKVDKAAQEAEEGVNRLVLSSRKATAGIADFEKATLQAINRQDQLIAQKNKTISSMSAVLDPNAHKTLAGTDYEEEVNRRIQAIKDEVAKLDQVDSAGERIILPEKDYLSIKRRIAELTQDAHSFIETSKRAKYGRDQFESHDVDSQVAYRKINLDAKISEWKRIGIYAGDLQTKAEELYQAIGKITEPSGLKKYLAGLKEANALAQLATQDKKAEKEKQRPIIAREKQEQAYSDWFNKALFNREQKEKAQNERQIQARQKEEQAYSDWWNKALFDKEQQEKAKDERVIAARKKKEEAYEAWWLKALYNKEKAPNLKYGKTTANATVRKQGDIQGAIDSIGITNPKVLAKIDAYNAKVQEVVDLREKFATDASAADNEGLVKQFQKATYEAEQLRRGIKAITDEEQRLMQLSEEQGFEPIKMTAEQLSHIEEAMIRQAQATADGRVEIKGWNSDHTKMNYTITNSKGVVEEMTMAIGKGTDKMFQYRTATKETGTLIEQVFKGIQVKAKELLSFVIGGGSIYKIIELLRQGIQYVREIDLALTELKKVTDETEESYDRFLETAAKTGARLGSTISAVTEATATFAKLGYTMEQSIEMAEAAIVYKNVGDNIASTEDAANSIISTLKGFGMEASESMEIVDRFNEVGNRFAITSQGIGEALRLSASALNEGKNSLDESIALITAANEVVNDPSSVGTALKTLTLRLRGSKTELEEMGEDVTGMATTTSQLQAKLLALTGGKVDIMLDENTFKNSTQILREMAAAWEDMTDVQRASALELMGGKRQANVLSALIQNFDTVEEVIETSANSSGSALKENERYLDSIQGKIDQFTNATQAMWSNTLDSDFVKNVVAFGTELIKIIDTVGLLNSALLILGAYKGFGFITETLNSAGISIDFLTKKLNSYLFGIDMVTAAESTLTQAQVAQRLAQQGLTAEQAQAIAAQTGLATSTANLSRETLIASLQAQGYSAAEAEVIATKIFGTTVTNASTAALLKETIQLKLANSTLVQYAISMGLATSAEVANMTITELLALGFKGLATAIGAATKAIITFLISNPVGWIILAVTAIAAAIASWIKWGSTVENLTEELNDLKSELSDVRSEIESINSELDTTNKRMAELLAKDSLTFTEQEELDNLQKQNDLLERELYLLEQKDKRLQAEAQETFNELMGKNSKLGRTIDSDGDGEQEVYNKKIEKNLKNYNIWSSELEYAKRALVEAEKSGDKTLIAGMENRVKTIQDRLTKSQSKAWEELDKLLEDAEGIDYESADPETRKYLDYIYNTQGRLNILSGDGQAKSTEIKRIFNKSAMSEAKDEIDELVEKLAKNPGDKNIIAQISDQCKIAEKDLKAVGLSVQDAINYYTQLGTSASYNTIDGKIKEIDEATKRLNSALGNVDTSSVDSIKQALTSKGWVDKNGKVLSDEIAEYFGGENGGISDETRKEIERLVKQIYDGKISVQDALKSFELFGVKSVIDIQVEEVKTNFKDVFSDLEDADGLVNTFKELGEAIGSTVGALEAFNQAQADVADKGFVSIQTALQLMEYTDDYSSVLQVVDGKLQLAANAEQNLIQARIDAIKVSAQTAVADAQAAYDKAELAVQSYRSAMVEEASASTVATAWQKIVAVAAGIKNALDNIWSGESIGDLYSSGYNTYLENATGYETSYDDAGLQALEDALADANKKLTEAKGNAEIANAMTADGLEDLYNPSEKKTPEEVADDAFQREMDYWENRLSANQARADRLQGQIDLLEQKGMKASADYYRDQITLLNSVDPDDGFDSKLELLNGKLAAVTTRLGQVTEGSEEWWEAAQEYNDIVNEIQEIESSLVDLQDAIGEIDTYKFEEFNTRLDNLASKLGTIRDLIAPDGEEDWFDDEGNWTEDGVAVLGTYIQELETYKQGLAEVQDTMSTFNKIGNGAEWSELTDEQKKAYADQFGIHSEQEYYDKQEELINQQYDYMSSISDTEQSVVDMYESSIDAVEEYTETLIDGYNDYIDSVKEALDAERDLYDFKRKIEDQSKSVAETERKIAALSGSTNAADVAERRRLQATLYDQQRDLEDSYRDHSRQSQQDALDSEAQAYEESMNKFVEGLRTSLEEATLNMDEFLMGVTSMVMYNADTILTKYEETNLPLTKELTNPWEEAKKAVGTYNGDALALMNEWTKEGGFFAQFNATGTTNLQSPWSAGTSAANSFKTSVSTVMSGVVSNISTNVQTASTALSNLYKQIQDTEQKAASANVTVNSGGSGSGSGSGNGGYVQKKYYTTATLDVGGYVLKTTQSATSEAAAKSAAQIELAGQFADFHERRGVSEAKYENSWLRTYRDKIKYTTSYYAKGTTGTTRDEWAFTDELGDELVLVPGKDGNLSFMRKGTSVVPADLAANLMEWGQFTPDSLNFGGGVNVNMINNAVITPQYDFSFDSLVHVDNCSQETLKDLEKMVDNKIDRFSKELNYSIKRFAR